ncbi:hypothetical protein S40293_07417 [Stachybotrys chartarum IBT 40293]|nr:hypothetical protein S40293_07417 [Stachybotrys chartarum IBT 40293]
MDPYTDPGREPSRQPSAWGSTNSTSPLRHEPSAQTLSDYYDYHDSSTGLPLRGRESLVSLQTQNASPVPQQTGFAGHSYTSPPATLWSGLSYAGAGAYAPVGASAVEPVRTTSRSSSRLPSFVRPSASRRDSEEIDMALLSHPAPIGTVSSPKYDTILEEEGEAPYFDVTATTGPISDQDSAFIKEFQDQEARGKLTGGIGQGFRPDTTVRDMDLLNSPTVTTQRRLSRSFTRRRTASKLGRAETIRHMGQDEANRRGEIIQVIVEEPAEVDLSVMEGNSAPSVSDGRRSTFNSQRQATQIFYPQPNWKPFAMRWPYLAFLVVVSLTLAVVQEFLFQQFNNGSIITFVSADDVDPGLYFVVKYVPTISAVVYGVLWQFVDFEIRRLEAFHQLSKPGGALAAESLNVNYVAGFNFFRPFRAIRLGHWAVALSSIATTLAISLVPMFAAASIVLTPGRNARLEDPTTEKALRFAATWSRLLTGTLSVCAVLAIVLFFLLQTRRSGLLADVRGIAGLASMAVVAHILMDFKGLDTAKHKDIHQKLKHRRYILRNCSLAPDDENPVSLAHQDKYDSDHLPENPHPLMLRPAGSIPFIIALILYMGFIPAFLFSPADVVTERAPWIVTALSICLKLSWNSMETAVRMLEPYRILAARHAPAKTLALDYTALPFGYLPIRAFLNGHMLVFFVGFGSIMTEFLTILTSALASVDGQHFLVTSSADLDGVDSGAETFVSFYVSLILSLFILLYMSVTATVVFVQRRHPFLPRQPNTISSVLAYIHQSKMLYDFVGTERMSVEEVLRKLGNSKTYGLGTFVGRDGQRHCGVDEEELKGDYKHGVMTLEENQPWNVQWDVYHH